MMFLVLFILNMINIEEDYDTKRRMALSCLQQKCSIQASLSNHERTILTFLIFCAVEPSWAQIWTENTNTELVRVSENIREVDGPLIPPCFLTCSSNQWGNFLPVMISCWQEHYQQVCCNSLAHFGNLVCFWGYFFL